MAIQRQGFPARVLSRVRLFVTPWTVTHQALCPWHFPGKNTSVGFGFLPQGIFLIQKSTPCLLKLPHCRKILYPQSHQGSPRLSMGSLEILSVLRVIPQTGHERQKKKKKLMALDLCCYWCVCECFLALRNIADLKERAQHESFKLSFI